jgi:hypothetical protein
MQLAVADLSQRLAPRAIRSHQKIFRVSFVSGSAGATLCAIQNLQRKVFRMVKVLTVALKPTAVSSHASTERPARRQLSFVR